VPREQHALELDVRARRLPPLRPSPVPTLIACHCSPIVLETAVRETADRRSVCTSALQALSVPCSISRSWRRQRAADA
jgi:hypothetical protein